MIWLLLLVFSFTASFLFSRLVGFLSIRYGLLDRPGKKLKNHERPVPYAGLAVWLTFMSVLGGLRFFTSFPSGTLYQLRGIVYGGSVIFILGFLDDIYDLHYSIKFLGQVAAAAILIYYNIYINLFPFDFLNILLSIFWVVLIINSVNIIDIMDGLASGVAAVCAMGFFAVTLPIQQYYVNFAALILFGTLAGFWMNNKPPARVFLGDSGSLFTGFILAALSMGADYSRVHIVGLFSPFLILGIPLYDTVLVIFFRAREGKSIFKGSKDHYAIRLSSAGFGPWKIDVISYVISGILAAAAFLITRVPASYAFFLLASVFFAALIGSALLDTVTPE